MHEHTRNPYGKVPSAPTDIFTNRTTAAFLMCRVDHSPRHNPTQRFSAGSPAGARARGRLARPRPAYSLLGGRLRRLRRRVDCPARRRRRRPRLGPVSYTHLRAHETLMNL
eukprot:5172781-Prymnesium_polylepis.1